MNCEYDSILLMYSTTYNKANCFLKREIHIKLLINNYEKQFLHTSFSELKFFLLHKDLLTMIPFIHSNLNDFADQLLFTLLQILDFHCPNQFTT